MEKFFERVPTRNSAHPELPTFLKIATATWRGEQPCKLSHPHGMRGAASVVGSEILEVGRIGEYGGELKDEKPGGRQRNERGMMSSGAVEVKGGSLKGAKQPAPGNSPRPRKN